MKINLEAVKAVISFIKDLCIALLAALAGVTVLSSCGVTTRATVRNNANANTTMSITITSPQNYTTNVHGVDSTSLNLNTK